MPPSPFAVRSADEFVATVTLNRPDRLNAFTGHDIVQFRSLLSDLARDRDVRAVVLTGAGTAFCAGGDVRAMSADTGAGSTDDLPPMRELVEVVELLHQMPKVTIAAINGACAGAGLSFAAACDLRVANQSAVFNTAFASVGQSGDYGSAWFLTRLVGRSRAAMMLFLSDRFDGVMAADTGFVQEIAVDALDRAQELARQIASLAPLTIAAIKENLNDTEGSTLSTYLDNECDRFLTTLATRDAKEAITAYVEKRMPEFEGR